MTALWVCLGIAAFLVLLLSLHFGIDANLNLAESPRLIIRVGAGGIFLQIYPSKKKAKKKKKPLFRRRKPKEKEKHKRQPSKPLSKKLGQIVVKAMRRAAYYFKALRLSIDASIVVASDNAYNTAMEYGAICSALSVLTPALYQNFSVHDCSIRVDADFSQPTFSARGHIRITTTIGSILGAELVYLFHSLRVRPKKKRKISKRKGNHYERASDQRHDGVEFGQNP